MMLWRPFSRGSPTNPLGFGGVWAAASVGWAPRVAPGPLKHPLGQVRIRGFSCRGSLHRNPGLARQSQCDANRSLLRTMNECVLSGVRMRAMCPPLRNIERGVLLAARRELHPPGLQKVRCMRARVIICPPRRRCQVRRVLRPGRASCRVRVQHPCLRVASNQDRLTFIPLVDPGASQALFRLPVPWACSVITARIFGDSRATGGLARECDVFSDFIQRIHPAGKSCARRAGQAPGVP